MNSQRLTLTGFVAGIVFAGLLSWLLSGCAGGAYYANAAPTGYTQRPFIAGGGFGLNNGFVRNGIGAGQSPYAGSAFDPSTHAATYAQYQAQRPVIVSGGGTPGVVVVPNGDGTARQAAGRRPRAASDRHVQDLAALVGRVSEGQERQTQALNRIEGQVRRQGEEVRGMRAEQRRQGERLGQLEREGQRPASPSAGTPTAPTAPPTNIPASPPPAPQPQAVAPVPDSGSSSVVWTDPVSQE